MVLTFIAGRYLWERGPQVVGRDSLEVLFNRNSSIPKFNSTGIAVSRRLALCGVLAQYPPYPLPHTALTASQAHRGLFLFPIKVSNLNAALVYAATVAVNDIAISEDAG